MEKPAAVILAGGHGRRLGQENKALVKVGGLRLIDRVLTRIARQCAPVALSVQTPQTWAEEFGLPVLNDRPGPDLGPLGGISAGLHWADSLSQKPARVITVPVDVPFLPDDLAAQLAATDTDIAVAKSCGQRHHTVAAWRPSLAQAIETALSDGTKAVHALQSSHKVEEVLWPDDPYDPFFNINTPDDLAKAEEIAAKVE